MVFQYEYIFMYNIYIYIHTICIYSICIYTYISYICIYTCSDMISEKLQEMPDIFISSGCR